MPRPLLLLLLLAPACGPEGPVSGSLLLASTGETVWLVDGLALSHDAGTTVLLVDRLGAGCDVDPATWSEGIFHVVYAVEGPDADSCYVYRGSHTHAPGTWEYVEDLPGCQVDVEEEGERVSGSVSLGARGSADLHGVLYCGYEPWS